MFCYQCQETLKNQGCTVNGICGKKGNTANLQDLLIYTVKGISVVAEEAGTVDKEVGHYIAKALFTTVTNVSFDDEQLDDINELPIVYNVAWYEQKAVAVLLALLHLGVKNIRLGPTLPAFLSPSAVNVLVENFGIGGVTNVENDTKNMIG